MTQQHSWEEELHAILAAVVGGFRYGFKIRVPHALVMTALFRRDLSNTQKIRSVAKLALEHASKLAKFATIYKLVLAIYKRASRYLRHHAMDAKTVGRTLLALIVDGPSHHLPSSISPAGHPDRAYHSFVAGCIGGYFVWGSNSSVNNQILLYLISRIQLGLIKRVWEKWQGSPHDHPSSTLQHPHMYPLVAACTWGIVMTLFEETPHVLQRSLRSSMDEIYRYQISDLSNSGEKS